MGVELKKFIYIGVLISLLSFVFEACVTQPLLKFGLTSESDRTEIKRGRKAILLVRLALAGPDGRHTEPFPISCDSSLLGPLCPSNFFVSLRGSDQLWGSVTRVVQERFLSEESRKLGWAYFLVSPGFYYMTVDRNLDKLDGFQISRGFQFGRWLIEVPPDAPIVYAGTLRLPLILKKRLFGASYTIIDVEHSEIHKEQAGALELVTQHLGDLGPVKTVLMKPHRADTFKLRRPKSTRGTSNPQHNAPQ